MIKRAVGFALLGTGCSLLGLDDFEVVPCSGDNTPCLALNEARGIDVGKDPEVYQCAPDGFGCELGPKDWDNDGHLSPDVPGSGGAARDCDDSRVDVSPAAPEVCDGSDNDCDGVIDEELFVGPSEPVTGLGEAMSNGFDFGSVATSRGEGVLDLISISSNGGASPAPDGASLLTLGGADIALTESVTMSHLVNGDLACPTAGEDPSGKVINAPCRPGRIVSDGGPDGHLAAAIDTTGCRVGHVRVGEIRGKTFQVASRPARASCNAGFPVVSPDPEGLCTEVADVRGAQTLDIARMPLRDGKPDQALVVWSGSNELGHGHCGIAHAQVIQQGNLTELDRDLRTSVGVAALGLWHDPVDARDDERGRRPVGVTGQGAVGVPLVLGQTRGEAAPAIESVLSSAGDAHYIVAFASDQGPALHAIARFDAMPEQCTSLDPRVPLQVIRSGEPWKASTPGHARADHVVLARGSEVEKACGAEGVGTELGLAWIEGCGLEDGSLWFATVDFSPSTGFCNPSTPLRVRDLARAPMNKRVQVLLAHAERGVLSGDAGGGFWLASVEPDTRVRVQRIAEVEKRVVDEEPLYVGCPGVVHAGLRATDDGGLELYAVSQKSMSYDLTRARIAGACKMP